MGKFTNGIAEIGFGDIGSQGEIATSFKPLGWTMEDSFKIISEEGSKTEFMVEEIDSPVFVTKKAGSFGFEFELADADVDALVYFSVVQNQEQPIKRRMRKYLLKNQYELSQDKAMALMSQEH